MTTLGGIQVQEGKDFRHILDDILTKPQLLHGKSITIVTAQGSNFGQLVQRTGDIVVLKTDSERTVVDGESKGKRIFEYSYIALRAIVSIHIQAAE
jgi:hypothetical protein